MNREKKIKQIVIRFDNFSYDKINEYAKTDHRGLGEFVRHAVLVYIENVAKENELSKTESFTAKSQ